MDEGGQPGRAEEVVEVAVALDLWDEAGRIDLAG